MGNKVGLSSFATMLALIIGGNLLGLFGMLLAIPMAATLKEILTDLQSRNIISHNGRRGRSSAYNLNQ